jgi:hypothetical protein
LTARRHSEVLLTFSGNLHAVVRSSDAEVVRQVTRVFSGGELPPPADPHPPAADVVYEIEPPEAAGGKYTVWRNGVDAFAHQERANLLQYIEGALTDRLVRRMPAMHLFHAGFVRYRGRGVLVPGETGAGKSTTVAALALNGGEFFSDEVAVIDSSLRVWPYPRAIGLKPGGWTLISDAYPASAAASTVLAGSHCPVSYLKPPQVPSGPGATGSVDIILLPAVAPGETPSLTPIPKSEAITRLVRQSLDLRRKGKPGFDLIVAMVQQAECYSLVVPNVPAVVATLNSI